MPLTQPVQKARRELGWFVALVFLLSGAVQGLIIHRGLPTRESGGLILLLMWIPGLVAFALRAALRLGVRDVSFQLGGRRAVPAYLVAWLSPVLVGGLAYSLAWATGLAEFDSERLLAHKMAIAGHPVLTLMKGIFVCVTMYLPIAASFAAGEELGWRGFMLTRLRDARVPRPVFVSGILWGIWHMPLILSGQYVVGPSVAWSCLGFALTVLGGAAIVAWCRLVSGSIWPAIIFHASWNAAIQGAFDPAARGVREHGRAALWLGEAGFLVAACTLLLAWGLWRVFGDALSPGAPSAVDSATRD